MMEPERWYEYQKNYQKYGFDMKPKPEPKPAQKRPRQRKTVKVPFLLGSGKKMAFSAVVAAGVIMIMLIMNVGHMLSLGFEKVLLMYTPSNSGVSDIIDTLVYRTGLVSQNYSYATAIGLFSGIVGLILVTSSNAVSRKLTGESIY